MGSGKDQSNFVGIRKSEPGDPEPSPPTHSARIATYNTVNSHGLSVGQAVEIRNASPNEYNGIFEITSVPTSTSFQYVMKADPMADATFAGQFRTLWQVGRLEVENNLIELIVSIWPII